MRLPDLLEDGQRSMPPLCVPSVCGGFPLAAWQQSAHRRGKTEGRAADVRPPRRESRVLWALHLNPADLHYVAFMAGVNRMAWSRFFLYNAANGLPGCGNAAARGAGLAAPAAAAEAWTMVRSGANGCSACGWTHEASGACPLVSCAQAVVGRVFVHARVSYAAAGRARGEGGGGGVFGEYRGEA